jgi:trans-2,3-dihydro-3-hydroxyanthranilate isomerase
VLYLCVVDPAAGTARARSVLLDHEGAAFEDPATGSAAGPLLAHLHARTGLERLTVTQGVEMARPSTLHCALDGDRVRVGGEMWSCWRRARSGCERYTWSGASASVM